MFFIGNKGHKTVFRGWIDNPDYEAGDFTKDGSYYDLDLSGIIPAGSIAAIITINVKDATVDEYVKVKHPVDVSDRLVLVARVAVSNKFAHAYGAVFCTTARKVKVAVSAGLNTLQLSVVGWIKK